MRCTRVRGRLCRDAQSPELCTDFGRHFANYKLCQHLHVDWQLSQPHGPWQSTCRKASHMSDDTAAFATHKAIAALAPWNCDHGWRRRGRRPQPRLRTFVDTSPARRWGSLCLRTATPGTSIDSSVCSCLRPQSSSNRVLRPRVSSTASVRAGCQQRVGYLIPGDQRNLQARMHTRAELPRYSQARVHPRTCARILP